MELLLNKIFNLSDEEIENSRLELNMSVGSGGEAFADKWLSLSEDSRLSGRTDCSYWGWYGKQRNFYPGDYVFSFIKLEYDEWLFVSAAKIIDVPENSRAEYEVLTRFQPFFGRLVIKYNKGQTYSRYVFKMKDRIADIKVKEILTEIYSGEHFPGYHKVSLTFAQLEAIVKRRPNDWVKALENQKAVYVITDLSNGKLYVGSATAKSKMLLSRWENYIKTGNGGNVELKKLSFEHIKKNFQFSIIENYNVNMDDDYIIEREQYWKKVLGTGKDLGYNRN